MEKEREEEDARISAEAEEAKRVLAMVEKVKDYGAVMEACIEEAERIAPAPVGPGMPIVDKAKDGRCQIAFALFDRATKTETEVHLERYLDRLISWYVEKDKEIKGIQAVPPPVPLPGSMSIFTPRVSVTERLANMLLDFLESDAGRSCPLFSGLMGGQDRDGQTGDNSEGT